MMKIKVKAPLLCYNILKGRGTKPFSCNLENSLNIPSKFSMNSELMHDFYCGSKYKIGRGKVLNLFVEPDANLINADNQVVLDKKNNMLSLLIKAKDATVISLTV